jgi:hypothetical protein
MQIFVAAGRPGRHAPSRGRRLALVSFTILLAAGLGLTSRRTRAQEIFATTTTFEITGGCAVMDLEPPFAASTLPYTVGSDAVVRAFGRYVFVINRAPADNVLVLDAANGYAVVKQYAVGGGDGSNIQDLLWIDATKAYVTRYEKTSLWIVHPLTGAKLGEIDLAAYADADGIPEMSQMARVGNRAFVALQRLDRNAGFAVTGTSQLVVLDTSTDTVLDVDPLTPEVDTIALQMQNPFWNLWFEPRLSRLLVVCPGAWLTLDGGLEVVNPFAMHSEGVLLDETALGGDLLAAVVVSPTLGYALRGELDFDTCAVRFDPSTGQVLNTVRCTTGFYLSDLELSTSGKLFLGDRTPSDPGVRVYDAATAAALTPSPVDVGLPPFDLAVVESAVTPVEPSLPAKLAATLTAWPNPFNPRASLALRYDGAPPPEAPELRILDARGRQVRTLRAAGRRARGFAYTWDGTNEDGRPVASGVYTAVPQDAQATPARLVLLR